MNRTRLPLVYALFDLLGSAGAWILFSAAADKVTGSGFMAASPQFRTGLALIPLSWVIMFLITGAYYVSLKRSRLLELVYSFVVTLTGVVILYFILLVNGLIRDNSMYFQFFGILFILQFSLTYIPRLIITSITARKVHKGLLGYRTLIIGSNGRALDTIRKIREERIPSGNIIAGYVSLSGDRAGLPDDKIPFLGHVESLPDIIDKNKIEEVIIAIEGNEHDTIETITGLLACRDVTVRAIPSLRDILTGRVEHSAIYGTPLLEISNHLMPVWQSNIKQIMDYLLALFLLAVLSPVIAVLSLLIWLSDKGPVIYSQERTGKHGRPFKIFKFRSMHFMAEKAEPLLSSTTDSRVTRIGRFMRKHRLDEIPNLVNVLRGEMSLVGPRPERQYFIDQITAKAPHFRRLLKVKPGITSWGQVKYGYASSVDQMIERLEYDLIYLENMSLLIDLKIIIYTVIIILKGKGV